MRSCSALVGRRNATDDFAFSREMSTLPYCALSRRCTIMMFPPESRIVMTTGHLFLAASASAPAMTFLACSKLMGAPYSGGAAGAWALATAAVKTTVRATTSDRSRRIVMGLLLGGKVGGIGLLTYHRHPKFRPGDRDLRNATTPGARRPTPTRCGPRPSGDSTPPPPGRATRSARRSP